MKQWKNLRIESRNGDLSKQWFVSWKHLNPETMRYSLHRRTNGINRIKTLKERTLAAKELKDAMHDLLVNGFTPYKSFEVRAMDMSSGNIAIVDALSAVVKRSESVMNSKSYVVFKSIINVFQAWLIEKQMGQYYPKEIKPSHILDFLTHCKDTRANFSNTSRNNYLRQIRATFNKMIKLGAIQHNPTASIDFVKSKAKRHLVYTPEEVSKIIEFLEENSMTQMRLMIQLITYAFLRRETACRLQLKDINLRRRIITIQPEKEKTGVIKHKRIVDQLYSVLKAMNLEQYPKDYYLLNTGYKKKRVPSDVKPNPDWFSKKFSLVKKRLGFSKQHTLYGFRHTAATDIYHSLRKTKSKEETLAFMMPITGHESRDALLSYLRDIGAEMPDDHSDLYSNAY